MRRGIPFIFLYVAPPFISCFLDSHKRIIGFDCVFVNEYVSRDCSGSGENKVSVEQKGSFN